MNPTLNPIGLGYQGAGINDLNENTFCSSLCSRYPARLVTLWEEFAKTKKSYNDHPSMFEEDQIFIILELKNGGNDSGDIKYRSPNQTYAMILQVIFIIFIFYISLTFYLFRWDLSSLPLGYCWIWFGAQGSISPFLVESQEQIKRTCPHYTERYAPCNPSPSL